MEVQNDVKTLLDEGENVIYSCRRSKKIQILQKYKSIIYLILLFIGSLLEVFVFNYPLGSYFNTVYSYKIPVFGIGALLYFFNVIRSVWKIYKHDYYYYITDHKVIKYKKGKSRSTRYLDIEKIQNVDIVRTKIENRFGSGSVNIKTERGYRSFNLEYVQQGEVNNLAQEIKKSLT